MSLTNLIATAATAAAAAAWQAAVYQLTKLAARLLPFLEYLEEGKVVIAQDVIQGIVNRGISGYDEIESLTLECQEGLIVACAECKKAMARFRIRFTIAELDLRVGKDRQTAEFRICEDFDVEGRNLIGKASARIAYSMISGAVQSEESTSSVLEKTGGIVELAWPRIVIHLDKHPVLAQVNQFHVDQIGVWDIVEITQCDLEPGRAVLKLLRHRFEDKTRAAKP